MNKKNNKKLIFFDFDGTLTKNNDTMDLLLNIFMTDNLKKNLETPKTLRNFLVKNANDWINNSVINDLFIKLLNLTGVDRQYIKDISNKIKLRPHVKETINFLKANDFIVHIISDGIHNIIEQKFKNDSIVVDNIVANKLIFNAQDKIVQIVQKSNNKKDYINKIVDKYNINNHNVFCVGNDINDEFDWGKYNTIAINHVDKEYAIQNQKWDKILNVSSMKELIPHLKSSFKEKDLEKE